MSAAFLTQLLISAVAVAALVGLSAWLGLPRVIGAMTEDQVRAALTEDDPDVRIDRISVAPDGGSAIVLSGEQRLNVKRVGDGHVVEIIPVTGPGVRRRGSLAVPEDAPRPGAAA